MLFLRSYFGAWFPCMLKNMGCFQIIGEDKHCSEAGEGHLYESQIPATNLGNMSVFLLVPVRMQAMNHGTSAVIFFLPWFSLGGFCVVLPCAFCMMYCELGSCSSTITGTWPVFSI